MNEKNKELLKKLQIAEEKANIANINYQNTLKKFDTLNKKITVNSKLEKLQKIINITITDNNKYKRLTDIGFDSIKVVEASTSIEELFNIKFNMQSLFYLTLGDFKNLTETNTIEYKNVIDKIERIKNKTTINDKHLDLEDDAGYCSFMLHYNIINDNDFKNIKLYQSRIIKGELGCKPIDDLSRFVEMSRKCVKYLKDKEELILFFKKEFNNFRISLETNDIEKIHHQWCIFNSKIINYIDPNLDFIPSDINDINVIFKYSS